MNVPKRSYYRFINCLAKLQKYMPSCPWVNDCCINKNDINAVKNWLGLVLRLSGYKATTLSDSK